MSPTFVGSSYGKQERGLRNSLTDQVPTRGNARRVACQVEVRPEKPDWSHEDRTKENLRKEVYHDHLLSDGMSWEDWCVPSEWLMRVCVLPACVHDSADT